MIEISDHHAELMTGAKKLKDFIFVCPDLDHRLTLTGAGIACTVLSEQISYQENASRRSARAHINLRGNLISF